MNENIHTIDEHFLNLSDLSVVVNQKQHLALSKGARKRIENCRDYLNRKVDQSQVPIYGVNTGFGSLCNTEISKSELKQLQLNLVRSHACGMGDEVPLEVVKLMLLLKIQGLSYGHSGVQLRTVERLIDFYNYDALPVIYEQGSLGASGDLAPLAHLSLPLLGEGEVNFKGARIPAAELNEKMNWQPIELESKEGLALLNGTQFMSAYAAHLLIRLSRLFQWSNFAAAASLDAALGKIDPFAHAVQMVRPHPGQIEVADQIRKILSGSELMKEKKQAVQDPYCLRCIPQVHGSSLDAINYARSVLEVEMNSVTDNPTVFEKEDEIISAGNFHGQPLALVLDFLAIAVAELTSISERRVYKLLSGMRGLPPFLSPKAGLNSGFMIVQYAAASAVSQNKQLASPASVDSIDSSNGQEDHVSMGANAATKLFRIVDNFEKVLGIEWLTACQALDFRSVPSSLAIEAMRSKFREQVPFVEKDQIMYPLMEKAGHFIREESFMKDEI